MADAQEPLHAPEIACLERTRSAVLNVLVAAGAGIAVSGWALGRLDAGALELDHETGQRYAYTALAALGGLSYFWRRNASSRAALRDPSTRADRFFRAHVSSAAIAAMAVPLGYLYGWGIYPRLGGVLPFWVAALALGFLAVPREAEVRDFDEPWPAIERLPSAAAVGGEA